MTGELPPMKYLDYHSTGLMKPYTMCAYQGLLEQVSLRCLKSLQEDKSLFATLFKERVTKGKVL